MARRRDAKGRFIKDTDLGWSAVEQKAREAAAQSPIMYDVGFFDGQNATKALYNELGAPGANIVERPFMRTTFDANEAALARMMREVALETTSPRTKRLDLSGLERIAQLHAAQIKEAITSWSSPGNESSTVEAKGKDDPLVDKGDMREAVEAKRGGAS
jgi:hypothetical protein